MTGEALVRSLNGWLAQTPALLDAAAWLVRGTWLFGALVLITLWFESDTTTTDEVVNAQRMRTREQVLLLFLAMLISFFAASVAAGIFGRAAPSPDGLTLPAVAIPDGARTGTFPDATMAYWCTLVTGLFAFRPRLSVLAAVAAVWIGFASVGSGQHYLTDLLAGASLGVLIGVLMLRLRSRLRWLIRPTALFFEGRPMIAYAFGCWLVIDLTRQFSGLTHALGIVFNVPVGGG